MMHVEENQTEEQQMCIADPLNNEQKYNNFKRKCPARKYPGWDYFVRRCRQNYVPAPYAASEREKSHLNNCEQCKSSWIAWALKNYHLHNLVPGQISTEDVRLLSWWNQVEEKFLNRMSEQERVQIYQEEANNWMQWSKQQRKLHKKKSAYTIFLTEKHEEMKEEGNFYDRSRQIAEMWSQMDPEEKAKWEEKTRKCNAETEQLTRELMESLPSQYKQIVKGANKVDKIVKQISNKRAKQRNHARPLTAFALYLRDLFTEKSILFPGIKMHEVMQIASTNWRNDPELVEKYRNQYEQNVTELQDQMHPLKSSSEEEDGIGNEVSNSRNDFSYEFHDQTE